MNRQLMVARVAELFWDGGGLQETAAAAVALALPQVSTTAELEDLPPHTIVVDRDGQPLVKRSTRCSWWDYSERRYVSGHELATEQTDGVPTYAPLTVAWVPEA